MRLREWGRWMLEGFASLGEGMGAIMTWGAYEPDRRYPIKTNDWEAYRVDSEALKSDWLAVQEDMAAGYDAWRKQYMAGPCYLPVRYRSHLLPCTLLDGHEEECVALARDMRGHNCKVNGCRELCDHGRRHPCPTCDPFVVSSGE